MRERSIPPGRLRRLAEDAYYRKDLDPGRKALAELKAWRAADPAEAEHAAHRSSELRQVFKSLDRAL